MQISLWLNRLFLIGILIIPVFTGKTVLASDCNIPSPCESFSSAEAVFVGRLQKIVEDRNGTEKIAYFQIERVFKGNVEKKTEVKFYSIGNCQSTFIIGKRYFVYKNSPKFTSRLNRTHLFDEQSSDFIYAANHSESNPVFNISAKVQGLSADETGKIKVVIEEGTTVYSPAVNYEGAFNFAARKKGTYHVSISFPFDAQFWVTSGSIGYDVKTSHSNNQTIIRYDLEFSSNGCDLRDIWFNKDYKIAESGIRGRVVNEIGNPVANLVVRLYPDTLNQNFTNWDFKLAKSNETGEYVFNKLKPGNYILGININRTPDLDTPYPETYFPGKKTFNETQVINLTQKQEINLEPFVISPKLKAVQVSGKIFWEDGTPATRFSPDSPSQQKPKIYLIDPITLKADLGSLIGTDEQGNFSFLAFQGYSYILHADAINNEKQAMHSKHLLIKVTENTSPIILKLSVKGEGKNTEEIKEELEIR